MIELKHITAGYGKRRILKDVSISFGTGELTCVLGVNGSGKSTLLKAILGIVPLNGGEIAVDGCEIGTMTRNRIAKKIAYLAQGKNTPNMTVEQMVLHGRFPHLDYPRRYKTSDREIAVSAMKKMGVAEYAQKSLHALSGGMRQNAYIAMALAQSTDYILLDEPTTYLDIANQLELMKTLRKLSDEGRGIVAVMHDLPLAFTFSDRIILLNDGNVVGDDIPEQICKQDTIQQMFGVSVEKSADGQSYVYKFLK